MNKSAMTLKERWTPGTLIDVFEVGKLQRLAEEDKVDVAIKWECGFTIERIEWLNGYDPDSPNNRSRKKAAARKRAANDELLTHEDDSTRPRILVWTTSADAKNDDGSKAVAELVRE